VEHGYCSGVCCMYAVKEAVTAKEHSSAGLETAIFFMDMRAFGKDFERYWRRAEKTTVSACPLPGACTAFRPDGEAEDRYVTSRGLARGDL